MENEKKSAFCEDSRVKFPTLMHLMGMGFKYVSLKGLKNKYVEAPKTEFVEEIAALCMCSTKTVRMWIHGVQKPDALKQKMISDKLGVPADILFPVTE